MKAMIKIYPNKGQDLIMQVIFDESIDNFQLTFYTDNIESGITKTNQDLKEENLIKINASELAPLNSGMLKCLSHTQTVDDDFNDNRYDEIQEITTEYYIKK